MASSVPTTLPAPGQVSTITCRPKKLGHLLRNDARDGIGEISCCELRDHAYRFGRVGCGEAVEEGCAAAVLAAENKNPAVIAILFTKDSYSILGKHYPIAVATKRSKCRNDGHRREMVDTDIAFAISKLCTVFTYCLLLFLEWERTNFPICSFGESMISG